MNDTELKDILLTIQSNMLNLQNGMNDVKNDMVGIKYEISDMKAGMADMKADITDMKSDITGIKADLTNVKSRVDKIELTLENDIGRKISVLFDGRIDEIRHREENMKTNRKVAELEMRVDNLEKAVRVS